MANAKRIRNIKFNTSTVLKRSRNVLAKARRIVAKEMTAALRKKVGRPSPPVSRPGSPPRKRTGFLQQNLTVTARGKVMTIKTPQYGIFLEGGTSRMAARPFISKVITSKDKKKFWNRRINTEARKLAPKATKSVSRRKSRT